MSARISTTRGTAKSLRLKKEFKKILPIIESYQPRIDPLFLTPAGEFKRRQQLVQKALAQAGYMAGIVFSDEQYCGDVPYLGGNTNVTVEQVAGVIGPTGFHIVAGLEGGYVAEQLSGRADAVVHKVELLQLADEKYPVRAERLEEVVAILPAMREPTISPLHGKGGYAVKSAVPRADLPQLILLIKAHGGTDIVVTKTAQIVA